MYWLWTDDYPYEGFDDWGLYEFEHEEDDFGYVSEGTITKVLYATPGALGVGDTDGMFDDSEEDGKDSRSQQRILKFLLGREF